MIAFVVAATSYWMLYGPHPTSLPKSIHPADVMVYADCTIRNEPLIDHDHADPAAVAKALADRCSDAYRRWLAVVTEGAKSQGVLSNYDMALQTVQMARRAAERAISLANRACYQSWGKLGEKNGQKWRVSESDWQAKLEGDHWKVWIGDEKLPGMTISVPRDGTPPDPRSCDVTFTD